MNSHPRQWYTRAWARTKFMLAMVLVVLIWETPAAAYIDPSTSGMLMQILAPILITLGMMRRQLVLFVRMVIGRIRQAIGRDG